MMDAKYRSRKFMLAVALTAAGCYGFATGKPSLSEFALLAGAILSAYGWTSNNDPDKQG